jgi:SAM-dependent methyltransferase
VNGPDWGLGRYEQEQGLEATFVRDDAASIPLGDGSVDLALSVFGVIFAPDAEAAVAELARVTSPGGRIVLAAWIPGGPISEAARLSREAIAAVVGSGAGHSQFAWHDADVLAASFAPHGFRVSVVQRSLAFTAASPDAYMEEQSQSHPLWIAGRAALEPTGKGQELSERVREIFEAGNEQPGGFRVTSRYVIATVTRALS